MTWESNLPSNSPSVIDYCLQMHLACNPGLLMVQKWRHVKVDFIILNIFFYEVAEG